MHRPHSYLRRLHTSKVSHTSIHRHIQHRKSLLQQRSHADIPPSFLSQRFLEKFSYSSEDELHCKILLKPYQRCFCLCVCVSLSLYMYTLYTQIHTYMHTYICIYIHTYIHKKPQIDRYVHSSVCCATKTEGLKAQPFRPLGLVLQAFHENSRKLFA